MVTEQAYGKPLVYFLHPTSGDARHRFGVAFNTGNYQQAERVLGAGQTSGEFSAFQVTNLAGLVALARRRHRQALALFMSALDLARSDENVAASLENIAETELAMGNFGRALIYAEAAMRVRPGQFVYPYVLASLKGLGAEERLRKAIELFAELLITNDDPQAVTLTRHHPAMHRVIDHPAYIDLVVPALSVRGAMAS